MAKPKLTMPQRFWAKVDKTETCWNWTAYLDPKGYGRFSPNGQPTYAHRISYEMASGPIPTGALVDHACRNRACVNPSHLQVTTAKQNNENLTGAYSNSTSGVRGVFKCKRSGKWQAIVGHNGKQYYAGKFADLALAEAAVIALRNELFTNNLKDRTVAE